MEYPKNTAEEILRSKLELVADRNERIAAIIKKLDMISEKIRINLKGTEEL